jgi:GNAT superfamily N-acetyltransferase
MSPVTIERIATTTPDEVREFLRREWAAEDRQRWGEETVSWEKETHLLRAMGDGQTAGVAKFSIKGGVAHLSEIIVAQAQRGRGIGTQLMIRFEKAAREAGCHKLSLRTVEGAPSVRFYRRLGYRVEGKMARHYHGLTFLQFYKFLDYAERTRVV